MTFHAILLALVIGVWNGNWFPSGRAEHRAHPDVEAATVRAAARMLRGGLDALDPAGTNDVILVLNEIRGPACASNLVAQIGRPGLRVASVSGYRRRDRFDTQQDVVATTLPVATAHWSRFRDRGRETPPRGYAFASLVFPHAVTAAVYAVHLKSDYGARKNRDLQLLNRAKRRHAIEQLVAETAPRRRRRRPTPVVIAGDFNSDRFARTDPEPGFAALEQADFSTPLAALPPERRATYPNPTWGDATLDYVYLRGFPAALRTLVLPNDELSDHQAVFTLLPPPAKSR